MLSLTFSPTKSHVSYRWHSLTRLTPPQTSEWWSILRIQFSVSHLHELRVIHLSKFHKLTELHWLASPVVGMRLMKTNWLINDAFSMRTSDCWRRIEFSSWFSQKFDQICRHESFQRKFNEISIAKENFHSPCGLFPSTLLPDSSAIVQSKPSAIPLSGRRQRSQLTLENPFLPPLALASRGTH